LIIFEPGVISKNLQAGEIAFVVGVLTKIAIFETKTLTVDNSLENHADSEALAGILGIKKDIGNVGDIVGKKTDGIADNLMVKVPDVDTVENMVGKNSFY